MFTFLYFKSSIPFQPIHEGMNKWSGEWKKRARTVMAPPQGPVKGLGASDDAVGPTLVGHWESP